MKRFQLGTRLPGIYLGIPAVNPVERKRLRQWFANLGWNTALSRPVCSVVLRNLATWTPPDGVIQNLQGTDVSYDLVHGWDYADSVLEHIKTNTRQGIPEIYRMALGGAPDCGIIRARRQSDGMILGTVVVYNERSTLAEHMPALKSTHTLTGGISSPVISPSVMNYATVIQGLTFLGIKQIRRQGADAVILDCVSCSRGRSTWMI